MNGENSLLAKYFGLQDPELYGGPIAGRSLDGFPVRGVAAPYLTRHEMEAMALIATFRARWFRLWDEEDRTFFERVMDHVANGEFFIKHRIDVPVPDHPPGEPGGSLKIWLEWVQVEAKPPSWAISSLEPGPDDIALNVAMNPGG